MIFLIDVDGTVGQLVPYVLKCLRSRVSKPETLPKPQDVKCDLFSAKETILSKEQLKEALKLVKERGFVRRLPLEPEALDGVEKIRKAGHENYWVTSPWVSSETWEYDRRVWVKKQFGDTHERIISTHAKHLTRGDVLIDDRVRNIRLWSAVNPTRLALLVNQPWNSDPKYDCYTRFAWKDIDFILEKLKSLES